MGGLSRKRTQSRIVKKNKPKSQKRICKTQIPEMLKGRWDQKKSLVENYANLGLALTLTPNMRHSAEGRAIKTKGHREEKKRMLMERARNIPGGERIIEELERDEDGQEWGVIPPQVDPNELFPGVFKHKDEIEPYVSVAKLRGDDVGIMKSLVAKYDDDAGAMSRDIKLNYMQWSKGQCKKNLKAYYAHGHDK